LQTIPGIGLIASTAFAGAVGDIGAFHSPRCHRPAYRSQGVIGILEPADDRRNEASA
jgi:hypothetical protein